MSLTIVAGWDPREALGFAVCQHSILRRASQPVRVIPLVESGLRACGAYARAHEVRDGQTFDVASDAPMGTSFAISRFLTPKLVGRGWALFCDFSDMVFLTDPAALMRLADPRYAVMVVKHQPAAVDDCKMDGAAQTTYRRKWWSSFVLWNCSHPSHGLLTPEMLQTTPGRDLHAFCWLQDHEIGELPSSWNHLVGVDEPATPVNVLHYTLGIPTMPGYETAPYADVWQAEHEGMTRPSVQAAASAAGVSVGDAGSGRVPERPRTSYERRQRGRDVSRGLGAAPASAPAE